MPLSWWRRGSSHNRGWPAIGTWGKPPNPPEPAGSNHTCRCRRNYPFPASTPSQRPLAIRQVPYRTQVRYYGDRRRIDIWCVPSTPSWYIRSTTSKVGFLVKLIFSQTRSALLPRWSLIDSYSTEATWQLPVVLPTAPSLSTAELSPLQIPLRSRPLPVESLGHL